jgi:hypothetical protein
MGSEQNFKFIATKKLFDNDFNYTIVFEFKGLT